MKNLKLSDEKAAILKFLGEKPDWCFPFLPIQKEFGMERNEVRRICRYLAKHNLLEFTRGLFNEDGEVAGSGYCITPKGVAYLREFHS